jgi:hypothetical protein
MKTIITLLALAAFAFAQSGCSAGASVGNHNQHGASVSAKTKGSNKGVHASVY